MRNCTVRYLFLLLENILIWNSMILRVSKIWRIFFNLYFFHKLFVTNSTQIRFLSDVYFSGISHITNLSQSYVTMIPLLILLFHFCYPVLYQKTQGHYLSQQMWYAFSPVCLLKCITRVKSCSLVYYHIWLLRQIYISLQQLLWVLPYAFFGMFFLIITKSETNGKMTTSHTPCSQ